MSRDTFDVLILNGRPAAGKSEIIDYLKSVPEAERIRRFHIGRFEELDDFPILWERFEDDDIYERYGKPRLISDTSFRYQGKTYPGYVFKDRFFWTFLIEKLNQAHARCLRDDPAYHDHTTTILEFSRGSQHGGFRDAYARLSEEILSRAVTIYIRVSWEESLRKNRRRANPDRPDSVLEHSLEDRKLEMLYKDSDWESFSEPDRSHLHVGGHRVPYAIFENEPEKTDRPELLGPHLEELCTRLWQAREMA